MAALGEGQKLRAGSRHDKHDDRMRPGPHKIGDVAVGKTDEGDQNGQRDQLGAAPFHKSPYKQKRPRVPWG